MDKKKITNALFTALVIIIFSSIAYAQTSQVQCKEVLGEPLLKKCFDNKNEVYNTTQPSIIADYTNLVPVTLMQVRLQKWNGTIESISQVGGTDAARGIFNFTSPNWLSDGKYEFFIKANTRYGVIMDTYVNFSINGTSMGIWVISPLNNHVDKPNFAFGKTQTFNLVVGLERPGDCRFSITQNITGTPNFAGLYANWSARPFTMSADGMTGTLNNFNMANYVTDYKFDGSEEPLRRMTIICNERRDRSRYTYDVIYIGADTTPPSVNVYGTPNPVFDGDNPVSVLNITSNDYSVCTIANIDPGRALDYKFIPSYDFTGLMDFKRQQYDNALLTDNNFYNYTFKLNITCENIAGLKNSRLLDVRYELTWNQMIDIISPADLTNQGPVPIEIRTKLPDVCYYTTNSTETPKKMTASKDGLNHTDSKSISDGNYVLGIECDRGGTAEKTFRVDRTPPLQPNITANKFTCSLEELAFSIGGNDNNNGSGIQRFIYNVTLSGDTNGTYSFSGTTSGGTIAEDIDGDEIVGKVFTISAKAQDRAGNYGSQNTFTITVSNDSIKECDFIKPNAIFRNATFNNQTKQALVYIGCQDNQSGCKPTFDYSIHETDVTCTYNNKLKNLPGPIILMNSSKVCYAVFDNNNNNDTDFRFIVVTNNGTFPVPQHCFNNKTDSDEKGIDCGGKDCKACVPLHCTNNKTDSDETGIDCGGKECKACKLNQTCNKNTDCESLYCVNNTCKTPLCTDGIKNGYETGKDCGGPVCSACALNNTCNTDDDCLSGNCGTTSHVCEAASCTNNKKDGMETDADCGGPTCPKCQNYYACVTGTDCNTTYCGPDKKCADKPIVKQNETPGWEDKDGDGVPAKDDPDDYDPDVPKKGGGDTKKTNPLALILLVVALVSLLSGAGLLIYENQEKGKKAKSKPLQQVATMLKDIPKPVIIQPARELTPEEKSLKERLRQRALKQREAKRRSLLNEFDASEHAPKIDVSKEFSVTPEEKKAADAKQEKKPQDKKTEQKQETKAQPKLENKETKPDQKQDKPEEKPKKEETKKPMKEDDVFEKLNKISKKAKKKK